MSITRKQFGEYLFDIGFIYDKAQKKYFNPVTGIVVDKYKTNPDNLSLTYVEDEPNHAPPPEQGIYRLIGEESKYEIPVNVEGAVRCVMDILYHPNPAHEGKEEFEIPIVIIEDGSQHNQYQVFRRTKNRRMFIGHFSETDPKRFLDFRFPQAEVFGVNFEFGFALEEGAKSIKIRLGGPDAKKPEEDKTRSAAGYRIEVSNVRFETTNV